MTLNFPNIQYIHISDIQVSDVMSATVEGYENLSIYAPVEYLGTISTELIWHGSFAEYTYLQLSTDHPEYAEFNLNLGKNYVNMYTVTNIIAQPKIYHHVESWLCNNSQICGNVNSINQKIDRPELSVVCYLAKNQQYVTYATDVSSYLSADNVIPKTYDFDADIHVKAIPPEGSAFYRWSNNYDSEYDVCRLNLSSNLSISQQEVSASFIRAPNFNNGTVFRFYNGTTVNMNLSATDNQIQDIIINY